MVRQPKVETVRETAPQSFPEIPPPAYAQAVGATYLVESIMQMQQTIGELKSTVTHLKEASDKQTVKLDRISHIIFASGVVLAIILGIGGFFMNKIWDGVVTIIETQNAPKPLAPPPYQSPPKGAQ
jgi:hypothetical protein